MVLTIFTEGTSYRTAGTPTFNGKSFTSLGRNIYTSSPEGSSEMWYLLLTPADTGSAYTVSVPNAATSRAISFHVSTFKSATGVSALDVNYSKNALGKNPSQSATTTANGDVIVAGMFTGLQTAPTVTSPGTQIYSSAATNYKGMSQYYIQSSAGTQALGWTSGTSDDYSMQTAAFKEANAPNPTTTDISPNSKNVGDALFTMTVTGTNFVPGSIVRFDGSARTTTYGNATSLAASIPGSDMTSAGTHSITVFNPAPGGGTSNAQMFTVNNNVPTTSSISPNSKNVGDALFTMTVTGTNFVSGSIVRFDGSDRTTTYVSTTSLTATIPASDMTSAGTHSITVLNPTPGGGTSNPQTFTVNNKVPTTSSIAPNSKNVSDLDFTMTVTGTNFVSGSIVRFDGSNRTTTYGSSTTLTATINASYMTSAGTHSITVFNPTPGGGTSNPQTFTVNNEAPTTTGISPNSKNAGDEQFIMTVTGSNFISGSIVKFDGSDRTTTYGSSTTLTAAIPASDLTAAGTHSITVFNPTPGGGTSNVQTFTVNNLAPTTVSISPNSKNAGDALFTMTVTGTNFVSGSIVRFDGSDRTTTYWSSTTLTAIIQSSDLTAAGTYSITVFNPTPGGGTSNAQTFTVNNNVPGTSSISPNSKNAGDALFTMTVTGTNFILGSIVRFDGSNRTTTYGSSTTLTAAIPTSDLTAAGTYSITVFNPTPGGGTSNAQTFTVNNNVPGTSSISPNSKNVSDPGFNMTVTGTNFVSGSIVRFDGSDRTTTFGNSTSLTAIIPASDLTSGGTHSITVFNPTPGGGTSNAQTFTVNNNLPNTTGISPESRTVGDAQFDMTVTGTNFVQNSKVRFNGVNRTTTYVSGTQLTAIIPATDMTTAGTSNITVWNPMPGGGTSNAQTFTVNNPVPTTSSISPNSKNVGDLDFTITVAGTNFVSGSIVRLDGSDRTTTYGSTTSLTATIPASDMASAGTHSITVFNPTPGGGTSTLDLTFTVVAAHTFDTSAQYKTTSWSNANPGTLSFTAGSGASIMVLTIFTAGSSYRTAGTPTFNGKSFTSLGRNMYTSSPEGSSEMWYLLLTPADTGSAYTVSVPNAPTSKAISFHVSTFKSPTGKSALDVNASKNGFGTNPSQSVTTTENGDVIVSGMFTGLQTSPTMTSPGTQIYSSAATNYKGMSQYYIQSSAGTQALGWTSGTSDDYSMQTAAFKEVTDHSVPTISSISPANRIVGDGQFTMNITGDNFVLSDSIVKINGFSLMTTYLNDTDLSTTIPENYMTTAGTYNITVFTSGGGISGNQTFTVNNAVPTITSLSPATRIVGDAQFIMNVTGTHFGTNSAVYFNGAGRSTTYLNGTNLIATIPASDLTIAGTYNITVVNSGLDGGTSGNQTFTVNNNAPTTSSISPNIKNVGDAQFTMTITGTNFVSGSIARFDGSDRTTTYGNATSLTVSITSSDLISAGTHSITVFNPAPGGGISSGRTFTVVAAHTFDTSATDGTATFATSPNPRILSYTAGSGASVMVLNIFIASTTARSGGAPTFNGKTFTQVGTRQPTAGSTVEGAVEMWYLLLNSSDTGSSFTVSVPNTGSLAMRLQASTYKSATGASALDVYAQRPNTGTAESNPSQSITTTVNGDVLIDALFDGGSAVPTANSYTLIYEQDGGPYSADSQYYLQTTAGSQALSWTIAADDFALITASFKAVNPVPATSSISPDTITVGDAQFDMTVTGTNFLKNSKVRLNGVNRTTTYLSATQLIATIPASNLMTAGTSTIAVWNPAPGGGTSNAQTFTVYSPTYTFSNSSSPMEGSSVTEIVNSTSSSGNWMNFTWEREVDSATMCFGDAPREGNLSYMHECSVGLGYNGTIKIDVIEKNNSLVQLGTGSTTIEIQKFPEFGKLGAVVPLFAIGILYMRLRKRYL
ncbi:MAG: hypothetical protein OIN85_07600 [Candidatus Methanoperedens sp.]|nr:hypothetical protein [Candidatus Methanoperedens sp.]